MYHRIKKSNEATSDLSPGKWPVEFVLVSNEAGRETFLNQDRIHTILAPAI